MKQEPFEYFRYAEDSIEQYPAPKYIEECEKGIIIPGSIVIPLTKRSFQVFYADDSLNNFCHYNIERREYRKHFRVSLTTVLADSTIANSFKFKDITVESLSEIITTLFIENQQTRIKAIEEQPEFTRIVTEELTKAGYTSLGSSPRSMVFRGHNQNITVAISDLGRFRATIRCTRKKNGVNQAFCTGGPVLINNASALVSTINSLK